MSSTIRCTRCGSSSFRYSRKKNESYCLRCGFIIKPEAFDSSKTKVKK